MKLSKFFALGTALVLTAFVALSFTDNRTADIKSSGPGLRSYVAQDADDTANASTTFVNSDLVFSIAAGQSVHVRYTLPFSLAGTTSGIKFQVLVPSGGVSYNSSAVIYSDADSVVAVSNLAAAAAQGFTIATVGRHYATIDFDYTNGSTAGSVALQFAQNASQATNTILLRGAYGDVTKR
jgi:hypothetical protein